MKDHRHSYPQAPDLSMEAGRLIASVEYLVFPDNAAVCCLVTLHSGYRLTGETICSRYKPFDRKVEEDRAFASALRRLNSLEHYARMRGGIDERDD